MIIFFLMLSLAMLLIIVVALATGWQQARERAIRAEMASMLMPIDAGARFARIEQALEGIALEVERLAEAQRFNARILEGKQKLLAPEASIQDPPAR